ncbi:3-ketoacyl-CoA synthase 6 [Sesamum alatum]|uniref:3-ketoacyl-CoA synthase 6 n=1 Tax=Sesamum alatum TaxID=300844 RepID=A0AAE1XR99_9LAMI|nr:3-ketoacyl-CoA synthase 6 [Sesamum alatum]
MAEIAQKFSSSVKLKYVKLGYQYLINHILTFLLVPIMLGVLLEILRLGPEEILLLSNPLFFDLVQVLCSSFLVIFIVTVYFMSKPRSIYLVDFSCYKPPRDLSGPLLHVHGAFQADSQRQSQERGLPNADS